MSKGAEYNGLQHVSQERILKVTAHLLLGGKRSLCSLLQHKQIVTHVKV